MNLLLKVRNKPENILQNSYQDLMRGGKNGSKPKRQKSTSTYSKVELLFFGNCLLTSLL